MKTLVLLVAVILGIVAEDTVFFTAFKTDSSSDRNGNDTDNIERSKKSLLPRGRHGKQYLRPSHLSLRRLIMVTTTKPLKSATLLPVRRILLDTQKPNGDSAILPPPLGMSDDYLYGG